MLKKSLHNFAADLNAYAEPVFLVAPNGVVTLTNRPEWLSRPSWRPGIREQVPEFEAGKESPLLSHELDHAGWTIIEGSRVYLERRYAPDSQWSVVLLTRAPGIFASRVLGIVITMMATAMALVYLAGRERWIQDSVKMDKRLELEELARELNFQATTDPLTGLRNRLKFNQALDREILRAERYQTPLSLVLYDIDHFKEINDTYGHQTGDEVLIDLSRIVAERIRKTDLLARWGGEGVCDSDPRVRWQDGL